MTAISILAIEDDAIGRVALAKTAERLGIDITVAHSLASASAVLAVDVFDLILVEWHLFEEGDQSFVHLISRLSERFSGRRVPILAVSALPLSKKTRQSLGIDDVLAKPYTLEAFADKLRLHTGFDVALTQVKVS